jgi:uncharacterized protein (TIGR00266 family)
MQASICGSSAFRYLQFQLEPEERLTAESNAMSSMDADLELTAKLNGGFISACARRFLGGESLFINKFHNSSSRSQRLTLTNPTPGDVKQLDLASTGICLQPGAFIACTEGLQLGVRWAGIPSFVAREGLFKLLIEGSGSLWFGAYGEIVERQLEGELIVDSGHLVAYEPQISLKIQLASGLIGSFLSGEGIVTRLEGRGKVYLQTRSMSGLVSWLNPKI